MPVAISFPDPVNSAAQFIDGVARGDAASSAKSQSADANHSAATVVSKDRKSSDEDFDAVLAMLLNGGIPPIQAPVVPVAAKVEMTGAESGTFSASDTATAFSGTDANACGNSSIGGVGQLLLQGRDSAPQQLTASLVSAKVAGSLSENTSTSDTAESGNANGLSLASTTSSTFSWAKETAAETQKGQGGVTSQVTEDVKGSPTQVLPIVGAATNVDAAATSVNISVLSEPPALVSGKPLSKEIMQALEQVGRPPESKVVADAIPPAITAAIKVSTSTSQSLGLPSLESQASVGSILALKSTSAVLSTTATTTATTTSPEQSFKGTTDQQVTQSSELKTFVSGLEDSPPSAATLIRSSSSKSVEAKTGITAAIESSKSIPDNAASATDLMAAAIQSGLTSSASPNSVPELAASISAEIGQPLSSQVSQAIMDHVERNRVRQSDSLSVRLDPPELGEMTIQLSKTHEGLAVRVTAREAVTMDMLFARGQEIESQLRGQHMNLKSLEFQRADMSHSGFSHGQGQPQQQNNSPRRSENLMNQIRSGARGLSPISNSHPRSATSDSNYGLSFRA